MSSQTPHGKFVACLYSSTQTNGQWKIAILPIEGGEPIKVFLLSIADRRSDGPRRRAGAYVDDVRDVSNIWLQPMDGESRSN